MKIVIVGSGNVATSIAMAFNEAEIVVTQIWSRQYQHALALATTVNAKAIEKLSEIDRNANFCIISVKDDAVLNVAKQLKGFRGIVLHTSGSVNINVFKEDFNAYGVFYPLQTFSKVRKVIFNTIPLCIEANDENILQQLGHLAGKISSNITEVDSEKRKILHLAAVFACNFTNHLYALSERLLEENGLAFDLLKPLIAETADKVQVHSPMLVQTGPASRNDKETLKNHEKLLLNEPQLLTIYETLSESIKRMQK